MSHHADPVSLLVLVVIGLVYLADRLAGAGDEEDVTGVDDELEELNTLYATDRISLDEHEDRVELLLDPGVQRLRARIERVDGVGDDISLRVAREFGSLDEVRAARQADLEDVHGVGPSTAQAIQREVGG